MLVGLLDLRSSLVVRRIVGDHDFALEFGFVHLRLDRLETHALRIVLQRFVDDRERVVELALGVELLGELSRGFNVSGAGALVVRRDAQRQTIRQFGVARVSVLERDVALANARVEDPVLHAPRAPAQKDRAHHQESPETAQPHSHHPRLTKCATDLMISAAGHSKSWESAQPTIAVSAR